MTTQLEDSSTGSSYVVAVAYPALPNAVTIHDEVGLGLVVPRTRFLILLVPTVEYASRIESQCIFVHVRRFLIQIYMEFHGMSYAHLCTVDISCLGLFSDFGRD